MTRTTSGLAIIRTTAAAGLLAFAGSALAVPPEAHTVPVDPNNPLLTHTAISGEAITLKGATGEDCASSCTYDWDPGDGTQPAAACSSNVDVTSTSNAVLASAGYNPYFALWCEHTYTGSPGDVFVATLTVTRTATNETSTATFRVQIRQPTLSSRVAAAIPEMLWFMHRNQIRFDGAANMNAGQQIGGPHPMGRWDFAQTGGTAQATNVAAAVNAFEANGYLETGPASSPYTETVARGLAYLFATLETQALNLQTTGRPAGSPDDPDVHPLGAPNGIGLFSDGRDPPYHLGMVIDAIVAAGTPGALAPTGNADVIGRTHKDIVCDAADYYYWAQGDQPISGGWRYGPWNNNPGDADNSTGGWAAIGILAAQDLFGCFVPQWVRDFNIASLENSDNESDVSTVDGEHGYTTSNFGGPTASIWGPYATAGAAMVQMVMDEIPSTTDAAPDERWIRSENKFRRHFNDAAAGNNFKNYYYAMFNFAKAMRLARPNPVVIIGTEVGAAEGGVGCGPSPSCAANGPQPLDWYNDDADGLARTIVGTGPGTGYLTRTGTNIGMCTDRPGNSQGSNQDEHNTSWCTQLLTQALFQASPVAIADASPNPTAEGVAVNFDGSGSFHQDLQRSIVAWEWDFDNDGQFDDASGVNVSQSFVCPPPGVPCSVPVTLRVTDDNAPALTDTDTVIVEITIPPHPPTADANGPYLACINENIPLDGSGSVDIDEGQSESGNPPFDTITAYEWDLDLASGAPFDAIGANGPNPVVSFGAAGVVDVGLRVTDNTAAAFPTAQQPNLTDTDSTTVQVADCSCIGPVSVAPKRDKNQLTWTPVPNAATYDIHRSTTSSSSGFSVIAVDHVTGFALYLDAGLTTGVTYWYRVTPKDANGDPICPYSEAAAGTPQQRRRR